MVRGNKGTERSERSVHRKKKREKTVEKKEGEQVGKDNERAPEKKKLKNMKKLIAGTAKKRIRKKITGTITMKNREPKGSR